VSLKPWSVGNLEQLGLGLVIEDEAASASIPTPEEAHLRSEVARQALDGKHVEWMDDYRHLMDAGWPWRVAAYIAWASSPKAMRSPRSQQELAVETLGLTSDRVITTWRKKNPAIDETIAMLQAAPLFDHRRDVINALVNSASSPDHKSSSDRRLFFEMTGDYVPHVKVDQGHAPISPEDLSDYSDAELDQIASALQKRETKANPITTEEVAGEPHE
jgi:hypothetical protein